MVNLTAHPTSFAYRGMQVYPPVLCIENAFHSFLHNKGLQGGNPLLVTFNNPEPVLGMVDVSGIALKDAPLDTWATRAQALFLEEEGVHMPAGFINRLREPLVSSYLLNSSVCVVQLKT